MHAMKHGPAISEAQMTQVLAMTASPNMQFYV